MRFFIQLPRALLLLSSPLSLTRHVYCVLIISSCAGSRNAFYRKHALSIRCIGKYFRMHETIWHCERFQYEVMKNDKYAVNWNMRSQLPILCSWAFSWCCEDRSTDEGRRRMCLNGTNGTKITQPWGEKHREKWPVGTAGGTEREQRIYWSALVVDAIGLNYVALIVTISHM